VFAATATALLAIGRVVQFEVIRSALFVGLLTNLVTPAIELGTNPPTLTMLNVSFAAKLVAVVVTLNVLHCCITPCLAGIGLPKVL